MKIPTPRLDATAPEEVYTDAILLDIIEYTLLPNAKQYEVLYYLNKIIGTVTSLLEVRPALHGERVIQGAIPNGDGCYFVLNPRIAGYGPLLALFLRNFLLANNRLLDHLFKGVRTSVHHGPVIPVAFLGTENFVGDGLNVCARLQGRAVTRRAREFYGDDRNFVAVSAPAWAAFEALFPPGEQRVRTYLKKIRFSHSHPFTIRDKHRQVPSYRVRFIDSARLIGSAPPRPRELRAS